MLMHLQCNVFGVVTSISGLDVISDLPTVVEMDFYGDKFGVGCEVEATKDIRGDCGWVIMMGEKEDLERDFRRASEIMEDMFEVED
jgi:hypothetical protein